MNTVDCEKLKQLRDDAYTQLVMVQIEAKENSAKKGIFGVFSGKGKSDDAETNPPSTADQDIEGRLAAAKKKYDEAKQNYENNCKG
jgi:hypothetical protein